MRLGYVLTDGKTKPGASCLSRPAAFPAIKPVEQAFKLLITDAGPRIFQGDADLVVTGFHGKLYGSASVRVPAAVFQ